LTFLRGIQLTGTDGAVRFDTIFPGYYMGRTNHIHFKVRIGGHQEGKSYADGHTSHVGQVFFAEELSAKLMLLAPYSKHKIHRTTQAEDGVFTSQHGEASICQLAAIQGRDFARGMRASLVAAVDPTATPPPARRIGGPGRPLGR
jgi:protocatechuate 3,4-dioxygenase beta subunit